MPTIFRTIKQKAFTWLESSNFGFRLSLRIRYMATGPHGYPDANWHNAVLKNQKEANCAISQVRKLGLPVMQFLPKNWDSLAALDLILKCTKKDSQIFDAGGELYSMILPWLFLYGYRNLSAGNLVFKNSIKKGPIVYHYSDITQTGLDSAAYDAVTCISVIEHGLDLHSYFCEMSRILKPGGVLITSTDYFETQLDTRGQMAYGVPIHIFTRGEIVEALEIASQFGLKPIGPLDLGAEEKVVNWKQYGLSFTFVIFSLRKTTSI
jgi:hypothetical protein